MEKAQFEPRGVFSGYTPIDELSADEFISMQPYFAFAMGLIAQSRLKNCLPSMKQIAKLKSMAEEFDFGSEMRASAEFVASKVSAWGCLDVEITLNLSWCHVSDECWAWIARLPEGISKIRGLDKYDSEFDHRSISNFEHLLMWEGGIVSTPFIELNQIIDIATAMRAFSIKISENGGKAGATFELKEFDISSRTLFSSALPTVFSNNALLPAGPPLAIWSAVSTHDPRICIHATSYKSLQGHCARIGGYYSSPKVEKFPSSYANQLLEYTESIGRDIGRSKSIPSNTPLEEFNPIDMLRF